MFRYIIAIVALLIAGIAAYFSVYGISLLFKGAFLSVLVMAGALEVGKLVSATFLHRYWKKISTGMKVYFTIAVVVLMSITSMGIYGFLSNAYKTTANELTITNKEVAILENKKQVFEKDVVRYNDLLTQKNERIDKLYTSRRQQEVRLDSLYQKEYWNSIRKTERSIKELETKINSLDDEISVLNSDINSANDSINSIEISMLNIQSSDETAADLGPLIYISEVTDTPMDTVVNYFILAIIFVFDPLAVLLIIAMNIAMEERKKKKSKPEEQIDALEEASEDPLTTEFDENFSKVSPEEFVKDMEEEGYEFEDIPEKELLTNKEAIELANNIAEDLQKEEEDISSEVFEEESDASKDIYNEKEQKPKKAPLSRPSGGRRPSK